MEGLQLRKSIINRLDMCLWCYLLYTQVNLVQGLVQWGAYALSGGDGALWTLLLHICEETLHIGVFLVSFAILCGNVQAKLFPSQHMLHYSSLLGSRVWLFAFCLFPSQRGNLKFYGVARILHFFYNLLSVIHREEPLWSQT